MFNSLLAKVLLCLFVCFTEFKKASLQHQSSIPSTQIEKQINATAEDIRSFRFSIAQEQILRLNDYNKILQIIHSAYQNNEMSFFLIMNFANALTRVDLTFYVLKALRNEMLENGHSDPIKMISLAQAFKLGVVLQRNNDEIIKADAENITKDILADVKNTVTEILTNELLWRNFHSNKVENLVKAVSSNRGLSEDIIREMINRTYPFIAPVEFVQVIWLSKNFRQLKVTAFLEVFKKLEEDNDLNNDAVLFIARYIKFVKEDITYGSWLPSDKNDINMMIDRLPVCARNLYFAFEACIWNRGKLEYLFTDSSQNYSSHRSVYSSPAEAMQIGEGSWVVTEYFGGYAFESHAFEFEYLGVTKRKHPSLGHYAETNEINIEIKERNDNWKIELNGDYCYIKNQSFDEYLYASDEMHSRRERYIFSAPRRTDEGVKNFLWQIRDCS